MTVWHVLAPEYPPGCGGVGEYTALVENALRQAGDVVHVWHPRALPDHFGPAARRTIEAALAREPGIVLVQYVPSGFGLRGMNLPFCLWLRRLHRRGNADVRIMFHEPFFYFSAERPWRNVLALVQRVMAAVLLRAGSRIYYSTETWKRRLAPYGPQQHVDVLPIPSTIPVDVAPSPDARSAPALRVGHFGTYGDHVAGELLPAIHAILLGQPGARVLLAGRGARTFASRIDAALQARIDVCDATDGDRIASALRSCDVLLQPYPDGVTTRRTSMMAALTTGIPVVTSNGPLTERVWRDSGAVALAPPADPGALAGAVAALAADPAARAALGARGRRLYDDQFALPVTLARMRAA